VKDTERRFTMRTMPRSWGRKRRERKKIKLETDMNFDPEAGKRIRSRNV